MSPADGTVVYVRDVELGEDVVVIKQGLAAKIADILREDVSEPKLVIGIFMSPFRHPARGGNAFMSAMHWRTLWGREPYYTGSVHIVQNERIVTLFAGEYGGERLSAYIVQIGARTVNGIDSYFRVGDQIARGATFGMIRIGSQVDLIVPRRVGLNVKVRLGDRVRAGETILIQ